MIIERLKKEDLKLYKDLIDEAFDGSNSIDSYEKYDENQSYDDMVNPEICSQTGTYATKNPAVNISV